MNLIRLASIATGYHDNVSAAANAATELIDRACVAPTDLVCLPELFAWSTWNWPGKMQYAEPTNGEFVAVMSRAATKNRVHLLAPLLEKSGNQIFNAMLWLDRAGHMQGSYRKAIPTLDELDAGVCPGPSEPNALNSEFGPIGVCICFDLNYEPVIRRLARQGTRLIIVPTMFQGLALMQAWARLYEVYFVSVAAEPYAAVVDPLGRTRIAPWDHDAILHTSINLDYAVVHTDHNRNKLVELAKHYGDRVAIEVISIEGIALVESRVPDRSVQDLLAELGIEPNHAYLQRSSARADQQRR